MPPSKEPSATHVIASSAVVQIESGAVECTGTDVRVFKGIPFAAAPIGEWRWRPPQPVKPWQGVRSASVFALDPIQVSMRPSRAPGMSEDCLSLNIWTPARRMDENLPVMVWLPGGSFVMGSGADSVCDGEKFARKGVILVTINYRVGLFGFFAHPSLTRESDHEASGNYGLMDQVAALRWVSANIAGFGGNAKRVTVYRRIRRRRFNLTAAHLGRRQRAFSARHTGKPGFAAAARESERSGRGGADARQRLGGDARDAGKYWL